MSVLAEFLLAMSFPVASVTLGAWLIWRRSRAAAEAKRLAELAARPLITRTFRPAYLRHRPMPRIVTTEDDIAALEKLQAAFKQSGVSCPDVHSLDSLSQFGALLQDFPDLPRPRRRIAPFVAPTLEAPAIESADDYPDSTDRAFLRYCEERDRQHAAAVASMPLAKIKSDLAKFASAMRSLADAFRGFARPIAMAIDSAARSEARRLNLRRQAARKGKPGWKRRGGR